MSSDRTEPYARVCVRGAGAVVVNGTYVLCKKPDCAIRTCYDVHYHKDGFEARKGPCLAGADKHILTGARWRIFTGSGCIYINDSVDEHAVPTTGWRCGPDMAILEPAPTLAIESQPNGNKRKRSAENASAVISEAWKQRKFTDAAIICDGERIPVHRAIICAASPVFEAAFSSSLEEGSTGTYKIRESSKGAVEAMLRFIYTGSLDCQSDDLPPLLELSVQYELPQLCSEVTDAILKGLAATNVRARATALKRHGANAKVKEAFARVKALIASDQALIDALI